MAMLLASAHSSSAIQAAVLHSMTAAVTLRSCWAHFLVADIYKSNFVNDLQIEEHLRQYPWERLLQIPVLERAIIANTNIMFVPCTV